MGEKITAVNVFFSRSQIQKTDFREMKVGWVVIESSKVSVKKQASFSYPLNATSHAHQTPC